MSTPEPLCRLIGINPRKLTKEENLLLEAELFTRICDELQEIFSEQYRNYFRLINFSIEKENAMFDVKFVIFIIQDILSTDEYNLQGIAYYTDTHADIIEEVMTGRNNSPSVILLRKLIDLHRSVRRDLYSAIIKKITTQYLVMK